jgi:hypothetical protein
VVDRTLEKSWEEKGAKGKELEQRSESGEKGRWKERGQKVREGERREGIEQGRRKGRRKACREE